MIHCVCSRLCETDVISILISLALINCIQEVTAKHSGASKSTFFSFDTLNVTEL